MKALVCELCGSNQFVKEGDYFVCQSCGTKYTTESAKSLMVEIDNTGKVETWYELARRSYANHDFDNARYYYQMILEERPSDWESLFYSMATKYNRFSLSQVEQICQEYKYTVRDAVKLINNSEEDEDTKEHHIDQIIKETEGMIASMESSNTLHLMKYGSTAYIDCYYRMLDIGNLSAYVCAVLADYSNEKTTRKYLYLAKWAVEKQIELLNTKYDSSFRRSHEQKLLSDLKPIVSMIKDYDSTFVIPKIKKGLF